MPAKDSYWLLRIGAGAGVIGAVLAGVGNLLHPITPRDDPSRVAQVIAGSDSWDAHLSRHRHRHHLDAGRPARRSALDPGGPLH
jgi:hypothetical protein